MSSPATGRARWTEILPGVALALAVMLTASLTAHLLGAQVLRLQGLNPAGSAGPVSGIMVAILLGLVIRNTIGVADLFKPGLRFSMQTLLRLGIILLGIRLSIYDALKVGVWAIPVVLITVVTGLVFTIWANRRLGQPERLGTLIAASTSICGVTAIVAIAPAIGADDEEIAYSVATVTLFGLIAMLAYPYLGWWLFANDPVRAGLFMGTAIHETAQVAGAALIYGQLWGAQTAVDVATVTKLLRNVFLVGVIPLLSLYYMRRAAARGKAFGGRPATFTQVFPVFILGFVAAAALRSLGDYGISSGGAALGLLDQAAWHSLTAALSRTGSEYLLGAAMAAVGLNTGLAVFRGVGWKPVLVGLTAALAVGFAGMVAAFLFGPLIG